ncbi:MAG: hypothetical protein J2P13_00510 [Acidobacteria bacterium]|nr:hypothetical protein [Acidobacteriota bacterium]
MRSTGKFAAVAQLILIACGLLTAGPLSAGGVHPAGCPLHHNSRPSPAPIGDHSCCQSGHNAAVVERAAIADHDFARSPLLYLDQDPVSFHLTQDSVGNPPPADTPPRRLEIRV